jgi:hypothetical protein
MENVKWRKAKRSDANGGNCVEVARTESQDIAARDSKNPQGPHLRFDRMAFRRLVADVKASKFDL